MGPDMIEMTDGPQAYPRLRTWVSGVAVGLVAATFAWVQWAPATVETQAASGDGGGVLVPGDPSEVDDGEVADDGEGGATVRRVEQRVEGDGGGSGDGAGPGGVDLGGGVAGPGGPGGPGGSGGGSDTGVEGDVVRLGATVAEDGIAKDFLGEVRFGINAVANRVNGAGGVHGRQLDIQFHDDAWDPGRGQRNIRNMIEDGVFAFAVSPSSEGLNAASNAGLFRENGVPVVGADGLNNTQFLDPWIWPVAAATTTQVHVLLEDARKRCAAASGCDEVRPAIVFGNTYRFGVEGAFAFNGAYCRITGGKYSASGKCSGGENIPGFTPSGTSCEANSRYCGISEASGGAISAVNSACDDASIGGGPCNFILLLLEPRTAQDWMKGPALTATDLERDGGCCGMAGAQPLFTDSFARECGGACNRMRLWTGYNPPLGAYRNRPEVAQYVDELDRASGGRADEFNQFTLGGYIGMTLLVEALEEAGRDLTREKLVATLNSMAPLKTGLTNDGGLRWTSSQRYANHSAQSFSIDFRDGQFNSFVPQSDYLLDPWLGQDNSPPG